MKILLSRRYMYKIHFLLVLMVAPTLYSIAQVTYDKEIEYPSFKGLHVTKKFLYTYTPVSTTIDQAELVLFGHDGELVNTLIFQAKRAPVIYGVQEFGDVTVFSLSTGERVAVDAAGKEVSRNAFPESVDKVKSSTTNLSANGITVVQQVKVKKVGVGLRVIHYDKDYQQKWMYEKFPEKGRYDYSNTAIDKDGNLAIMFSGGGIDRGICLLSSAGAEVAFTAIEFERSGLSTIKFEYTDAGDILYIGEYGSTSTEAFKGVPIGMGFIHIDGSTGAKKDEKVVSFSDVQAAAGDKRSDGTPLYTEVAPALHLLDVVDVKGKAYYLCESYTGGDRKYTKPSTTAGAAPDITYYTTVTLMDYYLLEVNDPTATPLRVWKQSRTVEQELGSYGGPSQALTNMDRNGLLSYKGMYEGKILTTGYSQMYNYYTLIDPLTGKEDLTKRTYWGEPINTLDLSTLPQRKSYNTAFGSTMMSKYFAREGILHAGESFMLYQYDYRTNMLQLMKLNF